MVAHRAALAMLVVAFAFPGRPYAQVPDKPGLYDGIIISEFVVYFLNPSRDKSVWGWEVREGGFFGAVTPMPKVTPAGGTLIPLPNFQLEGCPAKGGAVHPHGRFFYAASDAGSTSHVCALAFDPVTRIAVPIPGQPFPAGQGTRALALEPSGRFLYSANLDDNGVGAFVIDQATGALTLIPGSPFAAGRFPRGIVASPNGRFVYAVNQNAGQPAGSVSGFAIDPVTGALLPLPSSPYATPESPLAIAIDPRGRYLYVGGNGIQTFAIDPFTGALTGVGGRLGDSGTSIAADPSGRFVFAITGQTSADYAVAPYAIGPTGALTAGASVRAGANPRGLAVSRSGKYLYVVNSEDGTSFGFAVDPNSGALSQLPEFPVQVGESPSAIVTSGSLPASSQVPANRRFSMPVAVGGGRPPYVWGVDDGSLPAGLALDSGLGIVSGVPTAPQVATFTLRATDSAGQSATMAFTMEVKAASVPAVTAAIEYYNATLDHYFVTWVPAEQANLDAGNTPTRWTRTQLSFNTYTSPQVGASPVCRYYVPPLLGDSHFFGRGIEECTNTGLANPSFVLESPDFMHMFLPAAGVCPGGTTPVYRVFSNRADANHRYTTDRATRDQMVARGWLAEGDGPDLVVMCAPL